ncbi:ankyrin repeat domain-containing protein [Rickettsia amblyommatis]|uniref:Ankyrin repeat-containing protein n=1 Tax=Rickettsia amblyommatis (strain GAT-30V) TaxID=1105111 RepID=H8K654_RICAG|nr:ankyrin repeat domain-containing protein [Rickettsia amblyommatis]AEC46359.1 ankyrin repeat-containing protein [Rickettsia amblyommatis str. AaR/SC]AFC70365.1 ankyrin repeat-containing protein [Rickettsia amblyommatis str. GAT-30V]KJV98573.1 ankyrin repeat family protein [Rickettsia amblyommatis str. Darkwater]
MRNTENAALNEKLMRAAAQGNLEAVKKLVLRGTDIYFRDQHGDTALSLAAGNGYLDILEYLSSVKKNEIT